MTDFLKLKGIFKQGYGIIPKLVMRDSKLHPTAKAIYSYICSFAGAGDTAFPSVELITAELNINKDTFYKYLKQLIELNYLEVIQERVEYGKFARNIYNIVSDPCPKLSDTVLSDTVLPYTVKPDTNNNNLNNNNLINNKKDNIICVFDYYQSLGLKTHRLFTADMKKSIESAMKNNKYDIEYCKTLLDRHKKVVELTKNAEHPVTARGFSEFFGQKAYNAKHLICAEYDEGGSKYETYLKDGENNGKSKFNSGSDGTHKHNSEQWEIDQLKRAKETYNPDEKLNNVGF